MVCIEVNKKVEQQCVVKVVSLITCVSVSEWQIPEYGLGAETCRSFLIKVLLLLPVLYFHLVYVGTE
jgi:hypothetical protein